MSSLTAIFSMALLIRPFQPNFDSLIQTCHLFLLRFASWFHRYFSVIPPQKQIIHGKFMRVFDTCLPEGVGSRKRKNFLVKLRKYSHMNLTVGVKKQKSGRKRLIYSNFNPISTVILRQNYAKTWYIGLQNPWSQTSVKLIFMIKSAEQSVKLGLNWLWKTHQPQI